MKTLPTAGLLIISKNKLLLAYSNTKKAWYLPGGKVESGEEVIPALQREIKEELDLDLDSSRLRFYCHISALAFGEVPVIQMEQDCFLYPLEDQVPRATSEIGAIRYFSLEEYRLELQQVVGVLMVFQQLEQDALI